MQKTKKLALEDTNVAGIGSELDKKLRLEASQLEEAWKDAGKKEGVQVWRINNFKVEPVPKGEFGTFYNGDSYIVLKTTKVADHFSWTLHFWLGEFTTQDEAGTAAYKTVELDDFLGGKPVQWREISHHESETFLSYFNPPGIRLLEGGYDTGFNHVKPEEYRPRLLHIQSHGSSVSVSEVPMTADSLNSSDIFILDLGLRIIQWNGSKASVLEKAKAAILSRAIDDERQGKPTVEVHEEGDNDLQDFWKHLGGEKPIKVSAPAPEKPPVSTLWRLSDASGSLDFTKVAEGADIKRDQLDSKDAFILDAGHQVFAWIGLQASTKERKYALQYAIDYLKKCNRPIWLPISRILEGGENEIFEAFFKTN